MLKDIPAIFGTKVFNDNVMKQRLPKDTYKAVKKCVNGNAKLELSVANVVASAMKDWACENGATHFTHWFQPMTGITAEKHDSFISPTDDGRIIMEFSGKELVKGESDASSFPSGGLRATFEARGYTVWDTTSFAFIKDNTLCIPTAFCSYSGEALDKKTPLLRSMEALNTQAIRILRLFGNDGVKRVNTTVGAEQEYFLIDKDVYLKRLDLINCGRTLFGAKPAKGQQMEDHYYGTLKHRVSQFMRDFDEELWKLGILSKTKHNEVAPAQHELAPVFTTTNIATDHNQLIMEIAKSVANKHNLTCLLHEKPFEYVNGSGKHNNWSISTDTGVNLLEPGDTPHENAQFLLFLVAVIKAVNDYQDLLRVSVASAGNDHRLGANEAPPAIVSMFLGEELEEILNALENSESYTSKGKIQMEIGVNVLPNFAKDTTDRNRTSPFAFTGNKFEFRMVGSTFSIAGPNIVLNSIVADTLRIFADELEKATDFNDALEELICSTIKNNKRIIFNGNNYTQQWKDEAKERGLLNLQTTVDALPRYLDQKNIQMFTRQGVLTEGEIESRYEILLENYCKTVRIEATTSVEMVKRSILPCCYDYQKQLADLVVKKGECGIISKSELELLQKISDLADKLSEASVKLQNELKDVNKHDNSLKLAEFYKEIVLVLMSEMRKYADEIESLVGAQYWSLPTYSEILYSVN